jgi:hypothetical protein
MTAPLSARALVLRQEQETEAWHRELREPVPAGDALSAASMVHWHNYTLWHLEDLARDPKAPDQEIARVKRSIDQSNQRRNDAIERLDEILIQAFGSAMRAEARLHSETAGALADRLSINALKVFHMREEAERADATLEHREKCGARVRVLEEQRRDLESCLEALLRGIGAGALRFKVYRQMKMYNDPTLNPVWRAANSSSSG